MEQEGRLAPRERQTLAAYETAAAARLNWDPGPRQTHLLDYLVVLRKHMWLSLAFLLTVVTAVTIATFKMIPVYVASAQVEIDRENTSILPFQDSASYEMYWDMENYIETQAKILQSETLALQTIQSLELYRHPEFVGEVAGEPVTPVRAVTIQDPPQSRPAILGNFLGRMSIKRVPSSRLLEVTFEATDPELAARIVNTHLQNYVEHNFRARYESAMKASDWLAGQLEELKIKVERAEDARIAYERENKIWTIDEKQNITTQKLADLNRELTEAQTDRVRKEARYQMARGGNVDSLPEIRESTLLQDLIRRKSELDAQLAEARSRLGPRYPTVVRLEAQAEELSRTIEREKNNMLDRLEGDYRAARQREVLLSQALEEQKVEANHMAERLVQYNILNREADANKQLYEGLLQKLKEAGISAGLRSSNIRMVDPALIPPAPSRPQKARNLMLALLVGLVGGVGLAFLREYMDNTVKTPDDIEMLTRLPSLAVVPAFTILTGKGRTPKLLKGPRDPESGSRVALVSYERPQSQISEAFRALRTSLMLSQAEHPPQVILVTSSLPREGKSTAAVNLAVTFAQLGDRTILVDGDMRKPGIGKLLSMSEGSRHAGLSTYLAGVSSLELVTIPHPSIPNLAVIPAGPIPPNPADLLSSQRLRDMIAALRGEYKFIVFDSPPVMAATDSIVMSVATDSVLMVVRSGVTPKDAFIRARDQLMGVKSPLLGVVLNAVDTTSPDYYYSYRYYPYYHYYGDSSEKRPPSAA
jgi:succinoglycan biosynthesis transport protein ExoP